MGSFSSFDIMLHFQGLPNVNQHFKACPSSFRASAEAATTCKTTSQAQAFGACLALVDLDADRFSPLPSRAAGPCWEEWFGGGACKRVCHVRGSHFGWFYRGSRLPYFETNPTGKSTLDPGGTAGACGFVPSGAPSTGGHHRIALPAPDKRQPPHGEVGVPRVPFV